MEGWPRRPTQEEDTMGRLTPEEALSPLRECLGGGGRDTVLVDLATGTLLGLDPFTGESSGSSCSRT